MTPAEHVRGGPGPRGEPGAQAPSRARLGHGHGLPRGDEQPRDDLVQRRPVPAVEGIAELGAQAFLEGVGGPRVPGRAPDGDLQLGVLGADPHRQAVPGVGVERAQRGHDPRLRDGERAQHPLGGRAAARQQRRQGRPAAGRLPHLGQLPGRARQHDHDRAVVLQGRPRRGADRRQDRRPGRQHRLLLAHLPGDLGGLREAPGCAPPPSPGPRGRGPAAGRWPRPPPPS